MNIYIKYYADVIKAGAKKIDEVPEPLRKEVEEQLKQ